MPTVAEKRRTFRALHEQGCFVIPNPWDVGSARYLQSLVFDAFADAMPGGPLNAFFAADAKRRPL